VHSVVLEDLVHSSDPLIVAGFSSIGEIVSFIGAWIGNGCSGVARLVLGAEPFGSSSRSFASPEVAFTKEVENYWIERGISLRLSAQVVTVIDALDRGLVTVRFVHGASPLHAKVYVGESAVTVGSSNFTHNGLFAQIEANVRFEQGSEPNRFNELSLIGNNFWAIGLPWDQQFRALLERLLQVVSWREALARASAELLEGEWAERYLSGPQGTGGNLWPSQRIGIAQAMWIIENVGSVLIADATGSGKTRMGAHLVRAVRDRLWATGRVRRDLTVLVCPPSVENTWKDEAVACGLSINTVSHGKLSRSSSEDPYRELQEVHRAQLLAVDEAHNFLNRDSKRTRYLRDNFADHVMLFTATPISRGVADLLDLVALLGPDNFEDHTLDTLRQLERRGSISASLASEAVEELRREIQRFTLRRTKSQLNQLVDRDQSSYVHPVTGRVCRYPTHRSHTYETGETPADVEAAEVIRTESGALLGLAQLGALTLPKSLRQFFTDEQWLHFRLRSARGLASHHVLGALRSSRAALLEHLSGTAEAVKHFELQRNFKTTATGNIILKIERLSEQGPPRTDLQCEIPSWLSDAAAWRQVCESEHEHYLRVQESLSRISAERELTKARLLNELASHHDRVLVFDHHLITLAMIRTLLSESAVEVLIATGESKAERAEVERVFAPMAVGRAIALCSDAMNEGLNLQGAAAIVHLDLPTTLRVAEQRVGRVDRVDSPHDYIEAWWPRDGPAFATRANERLAQRVAENDALLGSNLRVPDLSVVESAQAVLVSNEETITPEDVQRELEAVERDPWDRIGDALDPARAFVEGQDALIPAPVYDAYRRSSSRVLARVAPLTSTAEWAFFSIRSGSQGAPRWIFVEPTRQPPFVTALSEVAARLRLRLKENPQDRKLDDKAVKWLERCLEIASRAEFDLMPRRMRRALSQMSDVMSAWTAMCRIDGREVDAIRWSAIERTAHPHREGVNPDHFAVAERWLELIAPALEQHRTEMRKPRYVLIRDVTRRLRARPFDLDATEVVFSDLPLATPLEERVSACILGVPD
jgi:hypothetical protein